ncbi:hypothetical protein FHR86_003755 [Paenarthrobacter ilicis]|uniref:Uncharacterized protein n=1 Tax=Paenarthrobacter ilicis TaxID=43665 RepID=A0ABX0TQD6_9MICC|nr:hypothetical protein [Paenarthrobacter ilicis]
MANPAALLHEQLERWAVPDQQSVQNVRLTVHGSEDELAAEHRRAMSHIVALDELISGMEASGRRRTRAFRDALPRWQNWVLAYPQSWVHAVNGEQFRSRHDLDVLENLADALDQILPAYDESARANVTSALDEIRELLSSDESLPKDLLRHLHGILRHAQECLDDYDKFGDFELQKTVERLLVAVNAAAHVSAQPGKWETIRDKITYPVLVGLAIKAPEGVAKLMEILPTLP